MVFVEVSISQVQFLMLLFINWCETGRKLGARVLRVIET